mgnify:CR=1 FL=1
MRPASRWIGALAALLSLAVSAPATAEDTLKLAIGQRGNWEQSAPEIGCARRHLQEVRPEHRAHIYGRRGRDAPGGDPQGPSTSARASAQPVRSPRSPRGRLCAASAIRTVGSNDLYWYVKADLPIREPEGCQRYYDDRLLDEWLLDQHAGAGLHQDLQLEGPARQDWQSSDHAHRGHVGTGRYRVGRAAVRPQGDRRRQNQNSQPRQRGAIDAQSDRPPRHSQCRQALRRTRR